MEQLSRPALTLRLLAASLAAAAGVVHLAQVPVHRDEGAPFVLFFSAVGALQLLGGLYLLRPIGPRPVMRAVCASGVAGSLATIAIWIVSRRFGLPFGAEPGSPEAVGLADAAASLFEVFTAVSLVMLLRQGSRDADRPWAMGASAAAVLLGAAWIGMRAVGAFDPDPRLVFDAGLTDPAAIAFSVSVANLFALLAAGTRRAGNGPLIALVSAVVFAVPLVGFTLPARGGQNLDCAYAPIAEDSGLSHAKSPPPIVMDVGDRRSVVVLLLTACADGPVRIESVMPLAAPDRWLAIESVSVDQSRIARSERVREGPSRAAAPLAGLTMAPGSGRYPVTVELRAVSDGRVALSAFRVTYAYRGERGSFTFASYTTVCVGAASCGAP